MMKTILAAAVLLILSGAANGQTIAGVEAPDTITLRVTKISKTSVDLHLVPGTANVTESASGYKMIAESKYVRYELSCTIVERHTPRPNGAETIQRGDFSNEYPNGTVLWSPLCEQFHVGDVVTFFSLENLVWLKFARDDATYTHQPTWLPVMQPSFYTLQTKIDTGTDGGRTRVLIMLEHAYTIDSETQLPRAKVKQ